jgi:hypothetical protein
MRPPYRFEILSLLKTTSAAETLVFLVRIGRLSLVKT